MAVQGGFVGGTLVAAFVNIADLVSARKLVCAGAMLGALANAAVLLVAQSLGRHRAALSPPAWRWPPSIRRP